MIVCDECGAEIENFLAERCDVCGGTFCPDCIDMHACTGTRDED